MADVLPGNGLVSTLQASISNSATSLSIASADASSWPASGDYVAVIYTDPSTGPFELVKVTGGQGTATLTVTRAIEAYNGDSTAKAWASGSNISAVLTKAALDAHLYLALRHEEFMPASSATTVTLANTPEAVGMVARGGVVQSVASGHYSVSGAVITFASSFSGSERVVVSYSTRGVVP